MGLEDEVVFAEGRVQYEGQPVGGIVADSERLARQAASLVRITYEGTEETEDTDDICLSPLRSEAGGESG